MEKLLSLEFFAMTFIAGLVINLLSAYIKEPLDRLLGQMSARKQKRLLEESIQFQADVELFRSNLALLMLNGVFQARDEVVAFRSMFLSVFALTTAGFVQIVVPHAYGKPEFLSPLVPMLLGVSVVAFVTCLIARSRASRRLAVLRACETFFVGR